MGFHVLVGDFDAAGIDALVKSGMHCQSGGGGDRW